MNNLDKFKDVLKANKVCYLEENFGEDCILSFNIKGVSFSIVVVLWVEGFKTVSLFNSENLVRTVLEPLSDEELLYLNLTHPKLKLIEPFEFLTVLRDLLK